MKTKWILSLLIISLLTSSTVFAQFKKYKAKTNYNAGAKEVPKGASTIEPITPPPANAPVAKKKPTPAPFKKATSVKSLIDKKNRANVPTKTRRAKISPFESRGADDIFGRGTGISNSKKTKKGKKYVNLNPETAFGPEVVTSFDFPNTSISDLTKHMQKLTGINLIIDKEIKGKVSIMAPSPITVGDAWKAYLTALNMNGLTLVKSGAFYKIVQARDIRYTPTKIYTGAYTPNTENYAMKILPLKNVTSSEITRSFRPFMSRYGRIIEIKQTNTVIIQDTGANINRLVRLVSFIDVPGHQETLQIIRVRHSSAQEIQKLLDQILKSKTSSKFRSSSAKMSGIANMKLIAEPRTNSIIAMANAKAAKQLRSLINKLDTRMVSSNAGKIHVYYLNHGDAETLAKTLSTLVGSSKQTKSGSRFSSKSSSSDNLFSEKVKITADKSNNALVVVASPTDYVTIKDVLKRLDIAKDQVYVEGLFMETRVSKNRKLGISIVGVYGSGGAGKAGFTGGSSDLLSVLTGQVTSLGGLFAGLGAGKKITTKIGGQDVTLNSVNGLITAMATHNNTNVLATPQILILDNEDGEFEVGESIPTPEKTTAANGSTSVSMKQQKVTLKLKITPQINKVSRYVKLKIDQDFKDFSTRALPAGLKNEGVATTERRTVTTVIVRDRDTIAMGGLMRDKHVELENKVPLLGDIPVLGWLFKHSTTNIEKVNMLFFLTPRILSPYTKTVAKTMKDLLNRRSSHLQNVIGEEDPHGTTVKGLYQKAKRQEKGPLYDQQDVEFFKRSNRGEVSKYEIPKYNQIKQKVRLKQAARKK